MRKKPPKKPEHKGPGRPAGAVLVRLLQVHVSPELEAKMVAFQHAQKIGKFTEAHRLLIERGLAK